MAHTPAQREIINSQKFSASWGESAKNGGIHMDFDDSARAAALPLAPKPPQ